MNISNTNRPAKPAKRLLLGGVAILGVVALAGCGGGGGMQDDGTKMDPPTPKQLSLADLKAGASVPAGTYTISGDETERAAILAALGALDTAAIPAAGLSAAGIKLRCAGTGGCGFEIEDGTFTVTGTIEIAASDGRFPSEEAQPTTSSGGGGGDLTPEPPAADPVVSLSAAMVDAPEGPTARITVTLAAPAPTGGLMVNYTLDGVRGTTTVPANQTSHTFDVSISGKSAANMDTVNIALVDTAAYNLGDVSASTITIVTPGTEPEVSVPPTGMVRVGGMVTVRVSLTTVPTSEITLMYTVDGDRRTVTIPANHQGGFTFTFPVPQGKAAGDSVSIVLTGGTGYTVGQQATHTVAVNARSTDNGMVTRNPVLGTTADVAALAAAIDGVTFDHDLDSDGPTDDIDKAGLITHCGTVQACIDIVNRLEAYAKAYKPLEYSDLEADAAFVADRDGAGAWANAVEQYQLQIERAYYEVEQGDAPFLKTDGSVTDAGRTAIRAAVSGAVSDRSANFDGNEAVNEIASDFGNDPSGSEDWGIWIKEGDANELYYWHTVEDGREAPSGATIAAGFAKYGGSATYASIGGVKGYGYYGTAEAGGAGEFEADISLTADFDAGDGGSGATITGTINNFSGEGIDPEFRQDGGDPGSVTLNSDYGVTSDDDVSGNWRPDYVYGEGTHDGTNLQPSVIRGRVTLNSTDAANPAGAAGVFQADRDASGDPSPGS